MPELPEVQTIVDDLKKKVVGRKITGFWTDTPKIVKTPNLEQKIKACRITGVARRGKNILIYLSKEKLLLVHQKLTGHLLVGKWKIKKVSLYNFQVISLLDKYFKEPVNDYIRAIFYLDNGWMIGLSDLRKFAKIMLGEKAEIESSPDLSKLGPEPLERHFNISVFKDLIKKGKRKIKQVLMDQEIIAGIGNIYSDEILWLAKVHPFQPANKLTEKELKTIWQAMRKILKKAVRLRGTSTSDFRDTSGKPGRYTEIRLAYQREGKPCLRCKTPLIRKKIGGRSAHYCPKCQRL